MKYVIHTDGGARGNPGPAACAAVVESEGKQEVSTKYLGETTNNAAEYQGVILAFELLQNQPLKKEASLNFYLDSLLVVSQLKGEYRIKNEQIKSFVDKIKIYENDYFSVTYSHVPREKNYIADKLVNKCLDESLHVEK